MINFVLNLIELKASRQIIVINFIEMSEGALSPLRKIKLFFPPIDSPLLTTFGKSVMPKVQPLK